MINMPIDLSGMTTGQMVDALADYYFKQGMDGYTSSIRACIDVAKLHVELFDSTKESIERLISVFCRKTEVQK